MTVSAQPLSHVDLSPGPLLRRSSGYVGAPVGVGVMQVRTAASVEVAALCKEMQRMKQRFATPTARPNSWATSCRSAASTGSTDSTGCGSVAFGSSSSDGSVVVADRAVDVAAVPDTFVRNDDRSQGPHDTARTSAVPLSRPKGESVSIDLGPPKRARRRSVPDAADECVEVVKDVKRNREGMLSRDSKNTVKINDYLFFPELCSNKFVREGLSDV